MGDGSVCRCGASLPEPDWAGLATCVSCGRITRVVGEQDDPDGGEPTWPPPPPPAPSPSIDDAWDAPTAIPGAPPSVPPAGARVPSPSRRKARPVGGVAKVGCAMVPVLTAVGVLALVASAVRGCDTDQLRAAIDRDGTTYPGTTLGGTSTLIETADGTFDVVVTAQTSTSAGTQRRLVRVRFGSDTSRRVWESEPLAEDLYQAEVAVVGDTIFAGFGDRVAALDADSGQTRWQSTLSDAVTSNCEDCFAAVDGRLVVRTVDAQVTAFAPGSAEPVWSRRLRSPSGSVAVPGDHLLVVDEPEDSAARTVVHQLDPATGASRRTFSPTCPDSAGRPWDLAMRPGDPVWPTPDSSDVVAVFGFGDGCVVRWNPDAGEVRWTSRLNGAGSLDLDGVRLGAADLVVPVGSALVSVDLASGAAKLLELPAETTANPGVIVGRQLVANTTTTRGTPRHGLASWDLVDGSRRWAQQDLGVAAPVSDGAFRVDALFDGSPRSLLVPVGDDRLDVMVFDGATATFAVRAVDLSRGTLGVEVRREFLKPFGGTASLSVETLVADRVLVSIDSLLQSLPASGRGAIVPFPPR